MLQHGRLAPAPETGDAAFDYMFAGDAGPKPDLLRSFEVLRSRRTVSYTALPVSLGQQFGPLPPGAPEIFSPAFLGVPQYPVRKWRVGGASDEDPFVTERLRPHYIQADAGGYPPGMGISGVAAVGRTTQPSVAIVAPQFAPPTRLAPSAALNRIDRTANRGPEASTSGRDGDAVSRHVPRPGTMAAGKAVAGPTNSSRQALIEAATVRNVHATARTAAVSNAGARTWVGQSGRLAGGQASGHSGRRPLQPQLQPQAPAPPRQAERPKERMQQHQQQQPQQQHTHQQRRQQRARPEEAAPQAALAVPHPGTAAAKKQRTGLAKPAAQLALDSHSAQLPSQRELAAALATAARKSASPGRGSPPHAQYHQRTGSPQRPPAQPHLQAHAYAHDEAYQHREARPRAADAFGAQRPGAAVAPRLRETPGPQLLTSDDSSTYAATPSSAGSASSTPALAALASASRQQKLQALKARRTRGLTPSSAGGGVLPGEASDLVSMVGYADQAAEADQAFARSRTPSPSKAGAQQASLPLEPLREPGRSPGPQASSEHRSPDRQHPKAQDGGSVGQRVAGPDKGDADATAGADDSGDGAGDKRPRMAELVRMFREGPATPPKAARGEAAADGLVPEGAPGNGGDGARAEAGPTTAEGGAMDAPFSSGRGHDAEEAPHPVDSLAAAVLQRSRALLRERDAIQQRIQAALTKYSGPGARVSPEPPSRLGSSPKESRALAAARNAIAKGATDSADGDSSSDDEGGVLPFPAGLHGLVGMTRGGSAAGPTAAAKSSGFDRSQANKDRDTKAETSSGSGATTKPAPWRERLKALLSQAGVEPTGSNRHNAQDGAPALGAGVSPTPPAPPPTLAASRPTELQPDPLEAWRQMRQELRMAAMAAGPKPSHPGLDVVADTRAAGAATAHAAALPVVAAATSRPAGDSLPLTRRFDGTLRSQAAGGGPLEPQRSAMHGALEDWLSQVADAAAGRSARLGGEALSGQELALSADGATDTAAAAGGWHAESRVGFPGLSDQAAAAGGAAAGSTALLLGPQAAGVGMHDELPSVEDLLARLARRFGLGPDGGRAAGPAAVPGPASVAAGRETAVTAAPGSSDSDGAGASGMVALSWAGGAHMLEQKGQTPEARHPAEVGPGPASHPDVGPESAEMPEEHASSASQHVSPHVQRPSLADDAGSANAGQLPPMGLAPQPQAPFARPHQLKGSAPGPRGHQADPVSPDGPGTMHGNLAWDTSGALSAPERPMGRVPFSDPSSISTAVATARTLSAMTANPLPGDAWSLTGAGPSEPEEVTEEIGPEASIGSEAWPAEDATDGPSEWPQWLSSLGIPRPVEVASLPAHLRGSSAAGSEAGSDLPVGAAGELLEAASPAATPEAVSAATPPEPASPPLASGEGFSTPIAAARRRTPVPQAALPHLPPAGVNGSGAGGIRMAGGVTPNGGGGGSFGPVLISLMDQAIGGLFADTPPSEARSRPTPPSRGTASSRSSEGGGAAEAGEGAAVLGPPGEKGLLWPVAALEPIITAASPSRRAGRGAGGGWDRLQRLSSDAASSLASSGGGRFAALLDHAVTAALFADSPTSSLDAGYEGYGGGTQRPPSRHGRDPGADTDGDGALAPGPWLAAAAEAAGPMGMVVGAARRPGGSRSSSPSPSPSPGRYRPGLGAAGAAGGPSDPWVGASSASPERRSRLGLHRAVEVDPVVTLGAVAAAGMGGAREDPAAPLGPEAPAAHVWEEGAAARQGSGSGPHSSARSGGISSPPDDAAGSCSLSSACSGAEEVYEEDFAEPSPPSSGPSSPALLPDPPLGQLAAPAVAPSGLQQPAAEGDDGRRALALGGAALRLPRLLPLRPGAGPLHAPAHGGSAADVSGDVLLGASAVSGDGEEHGGEGGASYGDSGLEGAGLEAESGSLDLGRVLGMAPSWEGGGGGGGGAEPAAGAAQCVEALGGRQHVGQWEGPEAAAWAAVGGEAGADGGAAESRAATRSAPGVLDGRRLPAHELSFSHPHQHQHQQAVLEGSSSAASSTALPPSADPVDEFIANGPDAPSAPPPHDSLDELLLRASWGRLRASTVFTAAAGAGQAEPETGFSGHGLGSVGSSGLAWVVDPLAALVGLAGGPVAPQRPPAVTIRVLDGSEGEDSEEGDAASGQEAGGGAPRQHSHAAAGEGDREGQEQQQANGGLGDEAAGGSRDGVLPQQQPAAHGLVPSVPPGASPPPAAGAWVAPAPAATPLGPGEEGSGGECSSAAWTPDVVVATAGAAAPHPEHADEQPEHGRGGAPATAGLPLPHAAALADRPARSAPPGGWGALARPPPPPPPPSAPSSRWPADPRHRPLAAGPAPLHGPWIPGHAAGGGEAARGAPLTPGGSRAPTKRALFPAGEPAQAGPGPGEEGGGGAGGVGVVREARGAWALQIGAGGTQPSHAGWGAEAAASGQQPGGENGRTGQLLVAEHADVAPPSWARTGVATPAIRLDAGPEEGSRAAPGPNGAPVAAAEVAVAQPQPASVPVGTPHAPLYAHASDALSSGARDMPQPQQPLSRPAVPHPAWLEQPVPPAPTAPQLAGAAPPGLPHAPQPAADRSGCAPALPAPRVAVPGALAFTAAPGPPAAPAPPIAVPLAPAGSVHGGEGLHAASAALPSHPPVAVRPAQEWAWLPAAAQQGYTPPQAQPHSLPPAHGGPHPYAWQPAAQHGTWAAAGAAAGHGLGQGPEGEDVIVALLKRKMDACMERLRSLESNLRSPPPQPHQR